MQLIPAIDIRGGRCVRLLKGDFDRETLYDYDPRDLAADYRSQGAEWLHVVDLDGARSGQPVNGPLIREIAAATSLRIQIGGGIRTEADLEQTLEYADRAVVGSLSVTSPDTVRSWLKKFGASRVTLGLDVRIDDSGEAFITTHGWTQASDLRLADAIDRYVDVGLEHVLCTDVDRDGALTGPNVDLYAWCVAEWPAIRFQASGGVSSSADLERLAQAGASSAISGKALLDKLIPPGELKPFLPNA